MDAIQGAKYLSRLDPQADKGPTQAGLDFDSLRSPRRAHSKDVQDRGDDSDFWGWR